MKLRSSSGGKIVVEHCDGYVFTFVVHVIGGSALDLTDVEWPASGAPPDADGLEQAARAFAEREAREQGWL